MKALLVFLALAIPALAQHSVSLGWSWSQGGGPNATGFAVQRGTVSGGPYSTQVCSVPVTVFACVDTASGSNILTEGGNLLLRRGCDGERGFSITAKQSSHRSDSFSAASRAH